MKELYFENLQGIGNLYLDKVFNSFEGEDIIFVCTDENGSYYFCVCYEFRYQLCWIATKASIIDITDIISKETDIHSLFKKSKQIINISDDGEKQTITFTDYKTINQNYIPTEGVKLREDSDLSDYRKKLILKLPTKTNNSYERFVAYELNGSIESNTPQSYGNEWNIPLGTATLQDTGTGIRQNHNSEWNFSFPYSISQDNKEKADFSFVNLGKAA